MAEKKKNSTKVVKKEDKKDNKNTKKSAKNSKALTNSKGKEHQVEFDTPSDKLIHQILPFVFIVVAILLETCFIFAAVTGEEHVGVAGVFLKNVFLGLFGFCAFVIPLMLINLALNWRKFVD